MFCRRLAVVLMLPFAALSALASGPEPVRPGAVRFASFNIEVLSAEKLRSVDGHERGAHPQLLKAAEILQRIRPDVLLVNEIDYDGPNDDVSASNSGASAQSASSNSATQFRDLYLHVAQNGQEPLNYPYLFYRPSN